MNCPYCDTELDSEDTTFCPNCGKSFAPENEQEQISERLVEKRTDLLLCAALLSMISAAFIASTGYIGIYQYLALIEYYGSAMTSEFLGFLIFGIIGVVCAIFAIVGSVFILRRKHMKISILGSIFPLIAVFATFITIIQYNYGFTENTILFSEISVFILSILSGALLLSSKDEFA
ncbi:hypothetical protein KJN74_05125 [Candidatus Bathyarchaeota archaeon]|nr:hypothetical protein [Candidatus Bathyarchaeota archaeon]